MTKNIPLVELSLPSICVCMQGSLKWYNAFVMAPEVVFHSLDVILCNYNITFIARSEILAACFFTPHHRGVQEVRAKSGVATLLSGILGSFFEGVGVCR